jgi:hypothetical protein
MTTPREVAIERLAQLDRRIADGQARYERMSVWMRQGVAAGMVTEAVAVHALDAMSRSLECLYGSRDLFQRALHWSQSDPSVH